jgi:hypothetical protein
MKPKPKGTMRKATWMLGAVALLLHEWSFGTSVIVSAFTAPLGTKPSSSWSSSTCWAEKEKGGYQFGDMTKGVLGKFTEQVNSVTGKEKYEFGDLSNWLDQKSKEKVGTFTNNNKSDYQFGDIS